STFFLLCIPPAPCSTLFPYTTLFRSLVRVPGSALAHGIPRQGEGRETLHRRAQRVASGGPVHGRGGQKRAGYLKPDRADLFDPLDRKSTRLNSSHVAISYAVFCLKKK